MFLSFFFNRHLIKIFPCIQSKSPIWQAVSMIQYHHWRTLTKFWQTLVVVWT